VTYKLAVANRHESFSHAFALTTALYGVAAIAFALTGIAVTLATQQSPLSASLAIPSLVAGLAVGVGAWKAAEPRLRRLFAPKVNASFWPVPVSPLSNVQGSFATVAIATVVTATVLAVEADRLRISNATITTAVVAFAQSEGWARVS
jgi:hypothetical protein